jgi:hypothetical protein
MKDQVIAHGDKLIAAAVVIGSIYWAYGSVMELTANAAMDSDTQTNVTRVERATNNRKPDLSNYAYAQSVPEYPKLVESHVAGMIGSGDPLNLDDPATYPNEDTSRQYVAAPRVFYGRPPATVTITVKRFSKEALAIFELPADVTVEPKLGRVVVSWKEGAYNKWVSLKEFKVYRKMEGGEWPAEPFETVAADPLPPAPANPWDDSGMRTELGAYNVQDTTVAPKKTYYYRVIATAEQGVEIVEDISDAVVTTKITPAEGAETTPIETLEGEERRLGLTSKFTDEVKAETFSNIRLVFKGSIELPDLAANFEVNRWNNEKDNWETVTAQAIREGGAIVGKKSFWKEGKSQSIKIDSGYTFISVEERVETTTQQKKVPFINPETKGLDYRLEPYKVTRRTKVALVVETKTKQKEALVQGAGDKPKAAGKKPTESKPATGTTKKPRRRRTKKTEDE